MAKIKEPDYNTPAGIKAWLDACGFANDSEAAESIGVPLRTFSRYKSEGLPEDRPASALMSLMLMDKMKKVLREKNQAQNVS